MSLSAQVVSELLDEVKDPLNKKRDRDETSISPPTKKKVFPSKPVRLVVMLDEVETLAMMKKCPPPKEKKKKAMTPEQYMQYRLHTDRGGPGY